MFLLIISIAFSIGRPILLLPSVNKIIIFDFSSCVNKFDDVTKALPISVPLTGLISIEDIELIISDFSDVNLFTIKLFPEKVTKPIFVPKGKDSVKETADCFAASNLLGVKSLADILTLLSIANTKLKLLVVPMKLNTAPDAAKINKINIPDLKTSLV